MAKRPRDATQTALLAEDESARQRRRLMALINSRARSHLVPASIDDDNDLEEARHSEDDDEDSEMVAPLAELKAKGLPSYDSILARWGEPQPEDQCFMCSHVGEESSSPLEVTEIKRIYDLVSNNRATMRLDHLVDQVHALFLHLSNRAALRQGNELPPWDKRTIARHLLGLHGVSTQLSYCTSIQRIREVIDVISEHSICVYDPNTERLSIDKEQSSIMERYMKLELQYMRFDPDKAPYANKGIQIDQRKAGQLMAAHRKNLVRRLGRRQ